MKSVKDIWSYILALVALLVGAIIFHQLDSSERTLINISGLVGSVASLFGLIIAYIQISKVAFNVNIITETYNNTIMELKHLSTVAIISRAVHQVGVIKELLDKEKVSETRNAFNELANDISILKQSDGIDNYTEKLEQLSTFCTQTESTIFTKKIPEKREELGSVYESLCDIEQLLLIIQEQNKLPVKSSDNG